MISTTEIKKLADLARIDLPDAEIAELVGEIDSILEYTGQIKSVTGTEEFNKIEVDQIHNVMRADENPIESGTYSKSIVAEFPESENNYLKVKKIL